jgi:hypothetical protein
MLQTVAEFILEFPQVIIEQEVEGVPVVSVQVDECLKALIRTLHKPVDGPFLVRLQVVLVEIIEEVLPQVLAKGIPQ